MIMRHEWIVSLLLILIVSEAESFVVGSKIPGPHKTRLNMSSGDTIAVIGATGKLGRQVVTQLSTQGYTAKCLIRQDTPPAFLQELPNVEFVKGDVTQEKSLETLLQGTTACLAVHGSTRRSKVTDFLPWTHPEDEDPTHAKQVNYVAMTKLLQAAKASGSCQRIVRITGNGEDPFGIFSILINLLGSYAKAWNYQGETILRSKDNPIDYTIIRPGIMKDMPAVSPDSKCLAIKDNGQSLKVAAIPYANVAQLCIACLDYPNAARSTLTFMTVPEGEGQASINDLLPTVGPDTRQFPSSLLAEHQRAVMLGGSVLVGVAATFLAVVIKGLTWALAKL